MTLLKIGLGHICAIILIVFFMGKGSALIAIWLGIIWFSRYLSKYEKKDKNTL